MRLVNADSAPYYLNEQGCEMIKRMPTINAVVIPDCNECSYNGDIAKWDFCDHCIGNTYKNNNFISKIKR